MEREELQAGYYATIPAPVLNDAALRWPAMVLYAKITSMAAKTGFCYAKNARLLEEMSRIDPETGTVTSMTERTLQSLLAELRDRGHIHMDTGPCPTDKPGVFRQGRRIFIGVRLASISVGEEIFTPENNFAKGVKKISPAFKGINNKNKYTPLPPIQELIDQYAKDDAELATAILGLLENRALLPKPKPVQTTRAMNGILNKLDDLSKGDRTIKLALLEKATVNNWLTVFPLKADEMPTAQAEAVAPKAARYVRTEIIDGEERDIYE